MGLVGVDHLVFACPDLGEGIRHVEGLLGVEVRPGGRHEGLGTRNVLVGLGEGVYLEVIGPDPEQPDPPEPRWFRVDELSAPQLVTWAASGADLPALAAKARAVGVDLGRTSTGGRVRPDGTELRWRVTDPGADRSGGVIPFFIDWGSTPHPSVGLPKACKLIGMTLRHPAPRGVETRLRALDIQLKVEAGPEPAVTARLETPTGVVELA